MTAKHTPGPWHYEYSDGFKFLGNKRRLIFHIGCGNGSTIPMIEDCRLIAAAPDLLDALETIVNELQAWASSGDTRPASWADRRLKIAREAITKAEGR